MRAERVMDNPERDKNSAKKRNMLFDLVGVVSAIRRKMGTRKG